MCVYFYKSVRKQFTLIIYPFHTLHSNRCAYIQNHVLTPISLRCIDPCFLSQPKTRFGDMSPATTWLKRWRSQSPAALCAVWRTRTPQQQTITPFPTLMSMRTCLIRVEKELLDLFRSEPILSTLCSLRIVLCTHAILNTPFSPHLRCSFLTTY